MTPPIEILNEAWRDAEDALAARHFGVSAEVDLDGESRLAYVKLGGVWGLVIKHASMSDAGNRTELLKTSKRLRIAAAAALPELYAALRKAEAASDRATLEAIEVVKKVTAQIREETQEGGDGG